MKITSEHPISESLVRKVLAASGGQFDKKVYRESDGRTFACIKESLPEILEILRAMEGISAEEEADIEQIQSLDIVSRVGNPPYVVVWWDEKHEAPTRNFGTPIKVA